jgi:toxin ParE1/3/4
MAQISLEWEDSAKEEVRDIYTFHYDRSVDYADHWSDQVVKKVNDLLVFPETGRMVPDIQMTTVREVFVGSYRLVYQYRDNKIVVLAVRPMGRPLGKI